MPPPQVYRSLWIAAVAAGVSVGHAQQGLPPPPPPPPSVGPATVFSAPGTSGSEAAPSAVGTALILGRVVDAATGRHLPGALVRLNDTGAGAVAGLSPSQGPTTPAMTNAQGQFLFRSLPAGRYSLSAQASGYLPGSYGQRRPEGPSGQVPLIDGQRTTDVTLRMWKYGAITGRLLDETGQPAPGMPVRVLRRSLVARQNRWVQGPQATTDDRGVFRFGLLVPGEYVVASTASLATVPASASEAYMDSIQSGRGVAPPAFSEAAASPAAGGTRFGDLIVQSMRGSLPVPVTSLEDIVVYQTVYYPAAVRLADAARVRVGPGEEKVGIDIQARLTRAYRVSGRIVDAGGQPLSAGLVLIPGDAADLSSEASFETASAVSGNDGRFTFVGVPPGQYTIKMIRIPRATNTPTVMTTVSLAGGTGMVSFATVGAEGPPPPPPDQPTLWAEAPLGVSGHVENVSIVVRSGARVRGTVEFDGPGPALEPRQRQQVTISLVPVGGSATPIRQPPPTRPLADGTFTTSQYPPGRYFANVSGPMPGWRPRAVMIGGRNALEEPIDLTADVGGAMVTFTSRSTELAGTVRGATGANSHASVLIFPADYEPWIANGMRSTRARAIAAGSDGTFVAAGLPAGNYRVIALAPDVLADVQDATLIERLASTATLVTLVEGEPRSVSLTMNAIR